MKKFTVLCLAGLLVLAFGVTAYAQETKLEFRASGFIDAQTFFTVNVPPLNAGTTPIYNTLPTNYKTFVPVGGVVPAAGGGSTYAPGPGQVSGAPGQAALALNRKVTYWDSRMHLALDAVMGKELSARLQFEIDACRWGDGSGAQRPGSEAHAIGSWSTDKTGIEVKYMYFDVGLPYFGIPVPMTVRLGAQPMAIRPWFWVATDGVGVSGGIKIDPVNLNPFYFKPSEGFDWTNDDWDIYGMQVNATLGTFTVGGYGAYYNANTYPRTGDATLIPPLTTDPFLTENVSNEANFWWFGLYADGKAGPVDINFDAGYDFGKVRARGSSTAPNSVQYAGWASRLKVDYPWEKFNFGAVGMYASGADANKTSSTGLPGTLAANGQPTSRVNGWMVPVGSEAGAVNQESVAFYGWEPGATGGAGMRVNHNYVQHSSGPFGGTWFAKLYGSYKATPWYKVTLQGLYIGDTVSHGNEVGNAHRYTGPGISAAASTYLRDDAFIGVELDMINEFQIYKNLVFKVAGGYLWRGSALDLYNSTTGLNEAIHSPWAIRTRLMYTF